MTVWTLLLVGIFCHTAAALGQSPTIAFEHGPDRIKLADSVAGPRILVDAADWPGVVRAAQALAADFGRVTGRNGTVELLEGFPSNTTGGGGVIVAGTIGRSRLVDEALARTETPTDAVRGRWETYLTRVVSPSALIIAGSDKRGAIYGLYDVAEQIGVSPWHFWADVPAAQHRAVYALRSNASAVRGPPSVKYRGIFLNDEAPALTGWVNAKFPRGPHGSAYGADFYALVFELLLRLRANTLWPAMWDGMFGVDDPRNQPLADEFGVVMGTSHTEPFMRSTKEWSVFGEGAWQWHTNRARIEPFLREGARRARPFESVFTVGMRGTHDTPMSAGIEKELLQGIVEKQREILGEEGLLNVTQVWCLYKEVLGYYDAGMTVPDDVTLLWADDNWGNIRRLPAEKERGRMGGGGVYYHFDYVGDPRNYKWINTVILQKTWHQMQLAYAKGARDIWIVNVGDLKPLEIPINHFLDIAYDINNWGPDPRQWLATWATREFGSSLANNISDVAARFSNLAGQRKFELVSPDTWSILNYEEADHVLDQWRRLSQDAQALYDKLDQSARPAFFEMVLHPALAGEQVHKIHVYAAKNKMYARQGRNSANAMAETAHVAFAKDHDLTRQYHELLGGKWIHMMDQTHLGYSYWQQPMRQSLPPLQYVQALEAGLNGDMRVAAEGQRGAIPGDDEYNDHQLSLPLSSPFSHPRWIEVFNTGVTNISYSVHADSFVTLSQTSGTLITDGHGSQARIYAQIEFAKNPPRAGTAAITVTSTSAAGAKRSTTVHMPFRHDSIPDARFTGFAEADGFVSVDPAAHPSLLPAGSPVPAAPFPSMQSSLDGDAPPYLFAIPDYGIATGPLAVGTIPAAQAPLMSIPFWAFSRGGNASVTVHFAPSLNTDAARPMVYSVSLDDAPAREVQVVRDRPRGELPEGWAAAVTRERWESATGWSVGAGAHLLRVGLLDTGLVLRKVVVDFGGVRESGLGPPGSVFVQDGVPRRVERFEV